MGGWVRTGRTADKGAFTFLELNDGSCVHSIQVLVKAEVKNPDEIKSTGVCVVVQGEIKASLMDHDEHEASDGGGSNNHQRGSKAPMRTQSRKSMAGKTGTGKESAKACSAEMWRRSGGG